MTRENHEKRTDLYESAKNGIKHDHTGQDYYCEGCADESSARSQAAQQRGTAVAQEIWGMLGGSPSNYPKK